MCEISAYIAFNKATNEQTDIKQEKDFFFKLSWMSLLKIAVDWKAPPPPSLAMIEFAKETVIRCVGHAATAATFERQLVNTITDRQTDRRREPVTMPIGSKRGRATQPRDNQQQQQGDRETTRSTAARGRSASPESLSWQASRPLLCTGGRASGRSLCRKPLTGKPHSESAWKWYETNRVRGSALCSHSCIVPQIVGP